MLRARPGRAGAGARRRWRSRRPRVFRAAGEAEGPPGPVNWRTPRRRARSPPPPPPPPSPSLPPLGRPLRSSPSTAHSVQLVVVLLLLSAAPRPGTRLLAASTRRARALTYLSSFQDPPCCRDESPAFISLHQFEVSPGSNMQAPPLPGHHAVYYTPQEKRSYFQSGNTGPFTCLQLNCASPASCVDVLFGC